MTTILLVEDQPALREVLKAALVGCGWLVLVAEDGCVALAILRNHSGIIDLVVSDLTLPFASGWELARASFELRPTTPFLMMSGYAKDPAPPFDHLANWKFIRKPFKLSRLRAVVAEMLASEEHKT